MQCGNNINEKLISSLIFLLGSLKPFFHYIKDLPARVNIKFTHTSHISTII